MVDHILVAYVLNQTPPDVKRLLTHLLANDSLTPLTTTPLLCQRCGASNAHKATQEFAQLQPLFSGLSSDDSYPISQEVIAEYWSNTTFLSTLRDGSTTPVIHIWLSGSDGGSSSGVLSLEGELATLRAGSRGSSLLEMHLTLLEGGDSDNGIHMSSQPSLSPSCEILAHRRLLMHALAYRTHLLPLLPSSPSQRNLPSNLGLFSASRHAVASSASPSFNVYSSGDTRFSVSALGRNETFRGVFRKTGFMLTYDTVEGTVVVITPTGDNFTLSIPLPSSDSFADVRRCFAELDAFIKWYRAPRDIRSEIEEKHRIGAALARTSCFNYALKQTLRDVAAGNLRLGEIYIPRVKLQHPGAGPGGVCPRPDKEVQKDRDAVLKMAHDQIYLCRKFLHRDIAVTQPNS